MRHTSECLASLLITDHKKFILPYNRIIQSSNFVTKCYFCFPEKLHKNYLGRGSLNCQVSQPIQASSLDTAKFFTLLCPHGDRVLWRDYIPCKFRLALQCFFSVPMFFLGVQEYVSKYKMKDSDTYFEEGGEAYCNQFPRSLKSDFLVRRNMYMLTDSVLSSAADKPFLKLFLRLVQKNSKCNLSLFVPADTISTEGCRHRLLR